MHNKILILMASYNVTEKIIVFLLKKLAYGIGLTGRRDINRRC